MSEEDKITDKTTGARRRRNQSGEDVHATEVAGRRDVHATGRAARAAGAGDAHATGRAARRGAAGSDAEELRPYERKSDRNLQPRPGGVAKAQAAKGWPDVFELDGVAYRNEGILSDSSGEAVVLP